jgi:hypothetical protein
MSTTFDTLAAVRSHCLLVTTDRLRPVSLGRRKASHNAGVIQWCLYDSPSSKNEEMSVSVRPSTSRRCKVLKHHVLRPERHRRSPQNRMGRLRQRVQQGPEFTYALSLSPSNPPSNSSQKPNTPPSASTSANSKSRSSPSRTPSRMPPPPELPSPSRARSRGISARCTASWATSARRSRTAMCCSRISRGLGGIARGS